MENTKNKILLLLILLFSGGSLWAQSHWVPNIESFEDYMTITGYIEMNGFELESTQYEVGCFIDNECRGTYRLEEKMYLGHSHPCLLSIWGSATDNGKSITLKVYDHENGGEYEIVESSLFQYGDGIGINAPCRFTIITEPLYSIMLLKTDNGMVSADRESAFQYEVITLSIVPAEGYELDSIAACKANDTSISVPLMGDGNTRTFTMPNHHVSIATVFKKTQATLDAEAVMAAVDLIEEQPFDLSQAEGNTEEELTAWLVEQLNLLLEGTGIIVMANNIIIDRFTAAVTGNEDNPLGTNGSYNFTVILSLGVSTASASQDGNSIIATPFAFSVNINSTTNGSVTSNKEVALEGTNITLSIVPAEGYELDSIAACKTNDTSVFIPLMGDGNARTFTMPNHHVSISASFKKTQDTLDAEAVVIAKTTIESNSFILTQKEGNTEEEVRSWLLAKINLLLSETGILLSEADIILDSFVAAVAGSKEEPSGINGYFNFTVYLSKGNQSDSTDPLQGTITAMLYDGVALKDVASNDLQAVIVDNGLLIRNLIPGEIIYIYNMQGQLLRKEKAFENELFVELFKHDIYIIVNGSKQIKVIY
ncbi:hypothetical protein LJB98_02675 [Bacteroidales bacterium OttesenSCG-928-M11]|nr:hypothetical protein [Bacteroidales bacterium OttesenSCG-928-M11]